MKDYETTSESIEIDINGSIGKVEDYNNIENEAKEADVVVIFAGTLQLQEIEGHD